MDFEALVVAIARILDKLEIRYAVTGGYAISIWGRPRATFDIDAVIELPESKIGVLASALRKVSAMSYIDENMMVLAVERKGEFNFIHIESGIKVDFWVQPRTEFYESKLRRRISKTIQGQKVYFVSPEDLILSKLLWHKESGSELQLRDVESVFKFQKKLDWRYLRKWAKEHSTLKVLKKLKKQKVFP